MAVGAFIITRARHLLLSPAAAWDVIAAEPTDARKIFLGYVGPLVTAAALAIALGLILIGLNLQHSGTFRVGAGTALSQAALRIALSLATVLLLGFLINGLAPRFGATPHAGQALKLAAYAPTASWVASLATIIPQLWIVSVAGSVYTLYLLFVGLPKLMNPAPDKIIPYNASIAAIMVVLWFVIEAACFSIMPSITPGMRIN
jgi:hypothetical protein